MITDNSLQKYMSFIKEYIVKHEPLFKDGIPIIPPDTVIENLTINYNHAPLTMNGIKALPNNVKTLVLYSDIDSHIIINPHKLIHCGINLLPDNLEEIVIGEIPKLIIKNKSIIPQSVKKIVFDEYLDLLLLGKYDKNTNILIKALHDGIEKITFWKGLSKNILYMYDNLLPKHLKTLWIGKVFNGELFVMRSSRLVKILPEGLKTLCISIDRYDYPLHCNGEKILPDSLKKLYISNTRKNEFVINGRNMLPTNLKILHLPARFNITPLVDNIKLFSDTIEELYFCTSFDKPLLVHDKNNNTIKRLLPNGLKVLSLSWRYNQPLLCNGISALPEGIEKIMFNIDFNQLLYDETENCALPKTLKKIAFRSKYDKPLIIPNLNISVLPQGLRMIDICFDLYYKYIKCNKYRVIPDSITKCIIRADDSEYIIINARDFPTNINKLIIYEDYLDTTDITECINRMYCINNLLPLPIAEAILDDYNIIISTNITINIIYE